jgi:hypothetical protein
LNFNSEEFTKKLTTCSGLKAAQDLGMNYLVVFYKDIDDVSYSKFKNFVNNGVLSEVASLDEEQRSTKNGIFGRYVRVLGTDASDSAKVYALISKSTQNVGITCKDSD